MATQDPMNAPPPSRALISGQSTLDRERGRTDGWRARVDPTTAEVAPNPPKGSTAYQSGWREGVAYASRHIECK